MSEDLDVNETTIFVLKMASLSYYMAYNTWIGGVPPTLHHFDKVSYHNTACLNQKLVIWGEKQFRRNTTNFLFSSPHMIYPQKKLIRIQESRRTYAIVLRRGILMLITFHASPNYAFRNKSNERFIIQITLYLLKCRLEKPPH